MDKVDITSLTKSVEGLKQLSDVLYMESCIYFGDHSNREGRIFEWFKKKDQKFAYPRSMSKFNIMSIGSSTGAFDKYLIHHFRAKFPRIHFTALELNRTSYKILKKILSELEGEGVSIEIKDSRIEDHAPARNYDLIYSINFVYRFPVVAIPIEAALNHLSESGKLVLFVPPQTPLNEFSRKFFEQLHGHLPWMSEDIQDYLDMKKLAYQTERIYTEFDAASVLSSDKKVRDKILSYLSLADVRAVPEEVKKNMVDDLKKRGVKSGNKFILEYPLDMIIASKKSI